MVGTPSPKPMELLGAGSCSWQNAYDELSYWVVLTIFLSFHNLLSSEWECLNSHLNCRAYHRLFIKNSCSLSWSWSLSGLYTLSLLHLHILLERVWFEGTLPIECWLYIGLYLLSPCLASKTDTSLIWLQKFFLLCMGLNSSTFQPCSQTYDLGRISEDSCRLL